MCVCVCVCVCCQVLEGSAQLEGGGGKSRREEWRETVRMRSGRHQHAGTEQVQVEFELTVDGKDAKDMAPKWRRALLKTMRASLENIRDRVEEDTRLNPSPRLVKEKVRGWV